LPDGAPVDPGSILAVEIDEDISSALVTQLGMVPGDGMRGITQHDVVVGAAADSKVSPRQFDLGLDHVTADHEQPRHRPLA
jgi:hypothetical protein